MIRNFPLLILISLQNVLLTESGAYIWSNGVVKCHNQSLNGIHVVKVELWDDDMFYDDLLDAKNVSVDGFFNVNAHHMDHLGYHPYIKIYHRCHKVSSDFSCQVHTRYLDYHEKFKTYHKHFDVIDLMNVENLQVNSSFCWNDRYKNQI
ncbi:unnamed protein product [Bursaphelenchus xylophilus]|uniref:(pine wood nematode) hypothetical protein n=1 Tax=Bursaphelenchus xylophilus TaxID=6326 RepID=A0A1I7SLC7_BURXY|nr:unnamed protein product [Bursaphelenchus xylophilus]CAG9129493.1 unnamed protein product [Bursaphelenchus xylophilus]